MVNTVITWHKPQHLSVKKAVLQRYVIMARTIITWTPCKAVEKAAVFVIHKHHECTTGSVAGEEANGNHSAFIQDSLL